MKTEQEEAAVAGGAIPAPSTAIPGPGQGLGSGPGPAKKQKVVMPDEYLPPNNILFIQNLPEGTTSEDLREVFEV